MSLTEQAEIVETFGNLIDHHCPRGAGYDEIGHEDGRLWRALSDGGWLDVGARSAGEDAFPLVTLALLAIAWGRRLPRLPLATSILARRRFDIEPGSSAKYSFALAGKDELLVPFGAEPGIVVLDPVGQPMPIPDSNDGYDDTFDPTLPICRLPFRTAAVPGWASELQVLLAAEAIGAAAEALDRAAAYAEDRKAFGRPISAFQSMRHWLADMHIALELGQSALLWATQAQGHERARALRECTRHAQAVATRSIQVFGGVGFTWELGIHAYLRHTMAAREMALLEVPGDDDVAIGQLPVDTRNASSATGNNFRPEVRAWLGEVVPKTWREPRGDRTVEELAAMKAQWAIIRQQGGYGGLRWPKENGGRGLGPLETMIYYEECAAAGVPEGVDSNPRAIGQDLAGPAIIAYGSDVQKARHLPRILNGDEIWCEGFSEPGAGSDLAAVATTAIFDGSVYRVNGSKIWTTYAHHADYCYLLTKTSLELPRRENLSVFLFNMRQPGVEVRPILSIAGDHEFNQVFFDDAIASVDDLLGELNGGWKMVTIGAKALRSSGGDGGTTVAWQRYVLLANWLRRLSDTMGDRPGTRDRVAALSARLEVLRWTNARNANIYGVDSVFPAVRGGSNVVKIGISEVLQEITELALDIAPSADRDFWRREFLLARARSIAGGSSQIQRDVIATQIMGLRKA